MSARAKKKMGFEYTNGERGEEEGERCSGAGPISAVVYPLYISDMPQIALLLVDANQKVHHSYMFVWDILPSSSCPFSRA